MEQVEIFEKYKDEKQDFLDIMLTWIRDLMVIKSLGDLEPLIHMDNKNLLLKQVPYLSYNRISSLIEGIEQIRKYDRLHINYTLLVEVMLIQAMNSK
jgi:DNA polymerase-3 subunit delta'